MIKTEQLSFRSWCRAEFLLEINLKILLRKTGARLKFKIALISLHIDPEPIFEERFPNFSKQNIK
jgi:hypothetical protein